MNGGSRMINKQNLWFLTLFSLILVLSVYYITMPNEIFENEKLIEEKQKEVIRDYAHQAYELVDYIENSKERIINEIVSEVTQRIEIEDVRPRTIEIYQNGALEKTLDKQI